MQIMNAQKLNVLSREHTKLQKLVQLARAQEIKAWQEMSHNRTPETIAHHLRAKGELNAAIDRFMPLSYALTLGSSKSWEEAKRKIAKQTS